MTLRRQDSQDKPRDWEPKPGDRVVRHPRQEEIGPVVVTAPGRKVPTRALASPMLIIYAFAGLIAVGTLLLMLPVTQDSDGEFTPLREALFTATSAVTVTGLVIQGHGGVLEQDGPDDHSRAYVRRRARVHDDRHLSADLDRPAGHARAEAGGQGEPRRQPARRAGAAYHRDSAGSRRHSDHRVLRPIGEVPGYLPDRRGHLAGCVPHCIRLQQCRIHSVNRE